jgi:hypothetical protein
MALRKVPGSRNYRADDGGFKEIMQSPGMSKGMVEIAGKLEGNASAVGDSTYESGPTTVRVGWSNELRQGAFVREVTPHWRDSRDAILLRVTAAMQIRNRP